MTPKPSSPVGPSDADVLKEGVNLLVEAYLASVSEKAARRYLHALAVQLNGPEPGVVRGITEADPNSPAMQQMRLWLRERLSVWVARYEG